VGGEKRNVLDAGGERKGGGLFPAEKKRGFMRDSGAAKEGGKDLLFIPGGKKKKGVLPHEKNIFKKKEKEKKRSFSSHKEEGKKERCGGKYLSTIGREKVK